MRFGRCMSDCRIGTENNPERKGRLPGHASPNPDWIACDMTIPFGEGPERIDVLVICVEKELIHTYIMMWI